MVWLSRNPSASLNILRLRPDKLFKRKQYWAAFRLPSQRHLTASNNETSQASIPEQNLLRRAYGRTVSLGKPMGDFATWLLTGIAAMLGAVIVNVEAVSKILSASKAGNSQ